MSASFDSVKKRFLIPLILPTRGRDEKWDRETFLSYPERLCVRNLEKAEESRGPEPAGLPFLPPYLFQNAGHLVCIKGPQGLGSDIPE